MRMIVMMYKLTLYDKHNQKINEYTVINKSIAKSNAKRAKKNGYKYRIVSIK